GASRLARQLEKDGLKTTAIHGDKSQLARLEALDDFKGAKVQVMVATDIAARGLDIDDLPLVINYELPYVPEDYIHRIGRTSRAARANRPRGRRSVARTRRPPRGRRSQSGPAADRAET